MSFLALVFGGRARHVLVDAALLAGMARLDALPHHGLTLLARYLVGFASVDKWCALVHTRGAALHRHQGRTQLQTSEHTAEAKLTHSCCNHVNPGLNTCMTVSTFQCLLGAFGY